MKALFSRIFASPGGVPTRAPAHSGMSSELVGTDIENYYLRIILDCLHRMLATPESVRVDVRRAGSAGPDGLPAFVGYVRILKWDPVVTPVLLQNIPVIDGRVRRVAGASVLLEGTQFGGLWFQATSQTENAPTSLLGVPAEIIHQPAAS